MIYFMDRHYLFIEYTVGAKPSFKGVKKMDMHYVGHMTLIVQVQLMYRLKRLRLLIYNAIY